MGRRAVQSPSEPEVTRLPARRACGTKNQRRRSGGHIGTDHNRHEPVLRQHYGAGLTQLTRATTPVCRPQLSYGLEFRPPFFGSSRRHGMNRVRNTKRSGLLCQAFVLIRLLHYKAPRLFSAVSGNKKLGRPIDVSIAWTGTRSDEPEHVLNCSPVVTRGMIVGEMSVDCLSCRCLPGLRRSNPFEQIPRLFISRDTHVRITAKESTTMACKPWT